MSVNLTVRRDFALSRLILGRFLSSSSQVNDGSDGIGHLGKSSKARVERIPVDIKEEDISEQFVRGSGPGGQATNKTSNKVVLHYAPLNMNFTSHETRSRHLNRQIARAKLVEHLDGLLNGAASKQQQRIGKERKRKTKAKRYILYV